MVGTFLSGDLSITVTVSSILMLLLFDMHDLFSIYSFMVEQVFIESDVLEVAVDMRDRFDAESDMLQHIDAFDPSVECDEEGWLIKNPMGIRTEREIHAEFEGAKIYRRLYQKLV